MPLALSSSSPFHLRVVTSILNLITFLLVSFIDCGEGFSNTKIAMSIDTNNNNDNNINDSKTFALNVAFHVKPERREEFVKVLSNHVEKSLLTEPNSIQFQLGQDTDDPNKFYLHEEFKNIDDHRGVHSNSEHYRGVVAFMETKPLVNEVCDEYNLRHPGPNEKVSNRDCVCLNVEINIKPELRDEFIEVVENIKKGADNDEPDCIQYTLGENLDTPNKFHLHEQYVDENGIAVHNASPHFKLFEEFIERKDPFTKLPIIQTFKSLVIATLD